MLRTLPTYVYLLAMVVLIAANVVLYGSIMTSTRLRIDVFAAGKGTAALIRTSEGKTILIDTGPDASILRSLGRTLPPWQHHIDTLILTSDAPAQAGGAPNVHDRYKIGETLHAGTDAFPYGTRITLKGASMIVSGPDRLTISTFAISSSTNPGHFTLPDKTE